MYVILLLPVLSKFTRLQPVGLLLLPAKARVFLPALVCVSVCVCL